MKVVDLQFIPHNLFPIELGDAIKTVSIVHQNGRYFLKLNGLLYEMEKMKDLVPIKNYRKLKKAIVSYNKAVSILLESIYGKSNQVQIRGKQ